MQGNIYGLLDVAAVQLHLFFAIGHLLMHFALAEESHQGAEVVCAEMLVRA